MKKCLLGLVLVAITSSFSMVYIDEGFESGTLDNVTIIDDDGDTNNWQIYDFPVKAGLYGAESVSTGLMPDNSIVFPSTWMELNSYLNFWIGAKNADSPEHYEVYIADDWVDPSNFILIYEETLTSSGMKNVEIDLKPIFLGMNEWFWESEISVKIRHYNTEANSADLSSLILDDFMVIYYPTFSYDEYYFMIPPEIIEPYSSASMRWAPYDRTMYDNDWNFAGLDNISLHYIFTDEFGSQPEETFPLTPNPDLDYEGTYICDFPGQPMGTTMEYWVEALDNTSYGLVGESEHFTVEWGEINFDEGFEYNGAEITPPDGWLPDGWVAFQTGEVLSSWDKPWEVDVPQQNVRSGEYSVTSAAQNNFGVWETEDYMVSPRLRVNGTPTLKYFVNAQTKAGDEFKERWSVLISTVEGDGTDIENFVEVVRDSIIPTADNLDSWYEKTFFLGDYEDEYVRIMWKHYYTSTEVKLDRYFNIDDISIAEMPKILLSEDIGNAAVPDEDFIINATVTDYSGINNVTIFYTLSGQSETSVEMNDNGDGTFTGVIPGQSLNSKCSWYAIATDNSAFSNTTTTARYDVVWFYSGCIEWGDGVYADEPDGSGTPWTAAIDFDFGTKGYLYLNKIEVGWDAPATNMPWRLVEFDKNLGEPTFNVIGTLEGINSFAAGGDTLAIVDTTPIYGHVALCFDSNGGDYIMLDEDGNYDPGDHPHSLQYDEANGWTTNIWGNFYIKMYVSQLVGIEDEFVSSTTELCQNYPNPFNPVTSISFYNRIAGDVELSVYNTLGEKVSTLVNEKLGEGFKRIEFNGSKLNSGVYYYTLRTPEKTLTKKMVLIK